MRPPHAIRHTGLASVELEELELLLLTCRRASHRVLAPAPRGALQIESATVTRDKVQLLTAVCTGNHTATNNTKTNNCELLPRLVHLDVLGHQQDPAHKMSWIYLRAEPTLRSHPNLAAPCSSCT